MGMKRGGLAAGLALGLIVGASLYAAAADPTYTYTPWSAEPLSPGERIKIRCLLMVYAPEDQPPRVVRIPLPYLRWGEWADAEAKRAGSFWGTEASIAGDYVEVRLDPMSAGDSVVYEVRVTGPAPNITDLGEEVGEDGGLLRVIRVANPADVTLRVEGVGSVPPLGEETFRVPVGELESSRITPTQALLIVAAAVVLLAVLAPDSLARVRRVGR